MARYFWTDRRFRQSLPLSGPTADRPVNPPIGTMYYDTDIFKPVWFGINSDWRSATNVVS